VLQQLKTEVVDRLLADPFFGDSPGIPVLDERVHELENEIDKAINQISGLCVLVTIPRANVSPQAQNLAGIGSERGPYFDSCTVVIRVFETPLINPQNNFDGTGKTGLETAVTIAALLHLFLPAGANEPLVCISVGLGNDPDRVSYDVVLSHRGGIKYTIPQVATPAISYDAGDVTITCATAGAAIFYTTTNAEPTPRSGTLYTAPFASASGVKVRARAWLAGYLGSKESSLTT
jgi:hypothetical protein